MNPVHHQKDIRAHSCLQVECSDGTDGKSTWTNNAAGQTYSPTCFFQACLRVGLQSVLRFFQEAFRVS